MPSGCRLLPIRCSSTKWLQPRIFLPYHNFSQYPLPRAGYSTKSTAGLEPIVAIPAHTNVYPFGAPTRAPNPLLRFEEQQWHVNEGESWAVVSHNTGGAGKIAVFKTLLGQTRIAPGDDAVKMSWIERGGLYPFLFNPEKPVDPYTCVSHVSFRQRTGIGGEAGAFFDYTARYGALREEEDRITLRESLRDVHLTAEGQDKAFFDKLTSQMKLVDLLDLPVLTLSNGQTRRARIVKAILRRPQLLLLDEPLTGLDVASRKILNSVLAELHATRAPRFLIGVRRGEAIPSWITNVLEIRDGLAIPQTRSGFTPASTLFAPAIETAKEKRQGDLVVDMRNVNVTYGDRKVLKNITWQIRQGDRWHLHGANGSGKTTLLALVTGDHPQSFTQPHLHLPSLAPPKQLSPASTSSILPDIFLVPRKRVPTAHLRTTIGVVSPEMFDAFPRRHPGMSVWEAVGTGFNGGFVPRTRGAPKLSKGGLDWVDVSDEELYMLQSDAVTQTKENIRSEVMAWRVKRCWEVLEGLGPAAWASDSTTQSMTDVSDITEKFAVQPFSSLPPGEQRLVLLMRALVGRPPLVLLDEAWSGMDDGMIAAARQYLRSTEGVGEDQAVVVITHWEEEVPWGEGEVKRFKLENL